MTVKQREYMTMYEKGLGVTEIARLCKVAKSSVSATLKKARQNTPKQRKGGVCPYSPSCFTCPLEDCRVGVNKDVNLLPVGFNYTKFMESCGRG